jgi:hypothetical protein
VAFAGPESCIAGRRRPAMQEKKAFGAMRCADCRQFRGMMGPFIPCQVEQQVVF